MLIGADDTERHKPDPDPVLEALARLGAEPAEAAYVGDSPFDIRAAKAAGLLAVASAGAGSTPTRGCSPRSRTCSSTSRRSCSMSSGMALTGRAGGRAQRLIDHHNYRYHVLDDPEIPDAAYDTLYDELKAIEEAHPELVTQRIADPTRRCPARGRVPEGRAPVPMGSLEKVTTDDQLAKWADDVRKRLGTDEPVAYVVEPKIDGSAIYLVYENGVLRARRDAR